MIPKIIHYCWFGGKDKPDLANKCISSWKKVLSEYEFIEWNESNFDFEKFPYAKEALVHRKYAYVTDVVRLYALYEIGGIYMDTDVEVLKPLDSFLRHAAFSGFESNKSLPTGLMAAEKGSQWAKDLLAYYQDRSFVDHLGEPILVPNTNIITAMMVEKGFVLNNQFQEKEGYVAFYPFDVLCAKSSETGKIDITEKTHCIHHFAGSWLPPLVKRKHLIAKFMYRILGDKRVSFLKKILNNV